eukprot:149175_1
MAMTVESMSGDGNLPEEGIECDNPKYLTGISVYGEKYNPKYWAQPDWNPFYLGFLHTGEEWNRDGPPMDFTNFIAFCVPNRAFRVKFLECKAKEGELGCLSELEEIMTEHLGRLKRYCNPEFTAMKTCMQAHNNGVDLGLCQLYAKPLWTCMKVNKQPVADKSEYVPIRDFPDPTFALYDNLK